MSRTAIDEKIAKLEAELKNAKASKSKEARKERTSQLISFGVMLENRYKKASPEDKAKIKSWMEDIDQRNRNRAIAGFIRLDTII